MDVSKQLIISIFSIYGLSDPPHKLILINPEDILTVDHLKWNFLRRFVFLLCL